MTITSLEFAGFVLVILAVYYVLPKRGQNVLLLAASYLFVASWSLQFALVYLALTLVNFVAGRVAPREDRRGRLALYSGIVVNIAALIYFKYANFFVPGVLAALERLGLHADVRSLEILLPIGLSYFVLQAVAYLLDMRQGVAPPVTSPVNFALYMIYFPRV